MSLITHSLVIAVLESYAMVERQCRFLARLLPDNWELIIVDDGSDPAIVIDPRQAPGNFQYIRLNTKREPGEWTQHEAINAGVLQARGADYIIKSDIDHVFTYGAIDAANSFQGDMLLFERHAGLLTDSLQIEPLPGHPVHSPVDDIFVMRKSIFLERGGYPSTRRYGTAGKCFWDLSRRPEAQPVPHAQIYVTPDTHEAYHGLQRVSA